MTFTQQFLTIRKPSLFILISCLYILPMYSAPAPPPDSLTLSLPAEPTERYGKFEATATFEASYDNPYDYDQIALSATFTSPSGRSVVADGFYMQDFSLNTSNGQLSAVGSGAFKIRFAPDEIGTWTLSAQLRDQQGEQQSSTTYSFTCVPSTHPLNHGFVRTSMGHYLQHDDGTPYLAIGENMAWPNGNAYLNYRDWLTGLIDNGANFIRLWHAHWGLGIEWRSGNGFTGLRRFHQSNCYYQDWLFDHCADNGVYIMLALQHHGPVSTQVNPNWDESPYNVANGGMCTQTSEFFTHPEAIASTKNRFRYIVARWGYARSIMCWELFNEVHWTDNYAQNKELIAEWHAEMAAYLKEIDPAQRIVSTSYGETIDDEAVWSDPNIDLTQSHLYLNTPNIERVLAGANHSFLEAFDKPTLNGEFGLGSNVQLSSRDPDGIHFHNALWGGLFSGALGTGMSWWWDTYIHPRQLYYHYNGLTTLSNQIPFAEQAMSPIANTVIGAPGDLRLIPSLGWAERGEQDIQISAEGVITPTEPIMSSFLYGSAWNTQHRQPPSFHVHYTQSGEFSVRTGNDSGEQPMLTITLDGNELVREVSQPNTTYRIDVPAGEHRIEVDNPGTDWLKIAAYIFGGLGSQLDAYVLAGADKSILTGWVLNNDYNHEYLDSSGEPPITPPAELSIAGFSTASAYQVSYYEPLSGNFIGSDFATTSEGKLYIPLPPVRWDLAFVLEGEPVGTKPVADPALAVEIFPNPIKAGSKLHLRIPDEHHGTLVLSLLDAGGLPVLQSNLSSVSPSLALPDFLPAGYYWVSISTKQKTGLTPLVITH